MRVTVKSAIAPPSKATTAEAVSTSPQDLERQGEDAAADGADGNGLCAPEHPPDEVDVVDAAVEEDAARGRREADEKPAGVDRVFGDAADGEDLSEFARLDPAPGLRIGRIEPAHEADHHDLAWALGRDGDDVVTVRRVERQGLFAEDVLSGANGSDRLIGVQ